MFKKSWMFVTTMSFDFARRFTKIGFSTASGRAISTSTMRPSDMSPKMPSSAPPFTPMRACAFFIIASLAVRWASTFALCSLSLIALRFQAILRRFSASVRRAFMAKVACIFAASISCCFSLNLASATFNNCVFTLKSASRRGMTSSRVPVKSSIFFCLSDLTRFFGFPPSRKSSVSRKSDTSKLSRTSEVSSSSSPATDGELCDLCSSKSLRRSSPRSLASPESFASASATLPSSSFWAASRSCNRSLSKCWVTSSRAPPSTTAWLSSSIVSARPAPAPRSLPPSPCRAAPSADRHAENARDIRTMPVSLRSTVYGV
mmetsp:Transcript_89347/g.252771  ORF Transcript_89347/g.252771 Transcript_89347/m.252771 type:complete len:318 (+) Transcript_89347:406-1359(+)